MLATYLIGNGHGNVLGLYYLPEMYVLQDLALDSESLSIAYRYLTDTRYAYHDPATNYVWVVNMFPWQVSPKTGVINPKAKVVRGAVSEFYQLGKSPFLKAFRERYAVVGLTEPHPKEGQIEQGYRYRTDTLSIPDPVLPSVPFPSVPEPEPDPEPEPEPQEVSCSALPSPSAVVVEKGAGNGDVGDDSDSLIAAMKSIVGEERPGCPWFSTDPDSLKPLTAKLIAGALTREDFLGAWREYVREMHDPSKIAERFFVQRFHVYGARFARRVTT